MPSSAPDDLFLQEQRKFKRLEVSLPAWITLESAYAAGGEVPWELGFTRDISLGGSKVIVPASEHEQWKEAVRRGDRFVLRFEEYEAIAEPVPAYVRHAALDPETGRLALGVQFDERVALDARSAAVRSGLKTVRARRTWQGAFVGVLCLAVALFFVVHSLRAEVTRKNQEIAALQNKRSAEEAQLAALSSPALATTRAEGIDASYQRKAVQQSLRDLTANIQRLNDPHNQQEAIREREAEAQRMGLRLTPASVAARVQLAVAFPYGYNWPLVLTDFETILGRKVPQVVIFRDWSEPFPDLDAQEARARGKILQVTWEPWHFGNPNAVKLRDIVAGKYDPYIDSWAGGARGFGGELWVRWGHEMNGNWYPWCIAANGQSPALWVAAYRHIHDRFRAAGAFNVRWVWCMNVENVPNVGWNDPLRAYPGDDYVDAVALDGYNFGGSLPHSRWQSFQELFGGPYTRLTARVPGKPLFVGETGCSTVGGSKSDWIKGMDQSLRSAFPRVESVTWFEAEKEADWRMESSSNSLAAARAVWAQPYYQRGIS